MNARGRVRKRRSDAERSIAAIIDAAVELFGRRPDANMSDIAAAAGVGRVTLYAHFPSREAVLTAALQNALVETSEALDAAELDRGPAPEAMRRLIERSWPILDRHRGLLSAGELSAERLREHHTRILDRIDRLIRHGQAEGSFRSDLSSQWLVAACYSLIHGVAQEVTAGKLAAGEATTILEATLLGALAPSGALARADHSVDAQPLDPRAPAESPGPEPRR